jgi:hypothetical protein
MCGCFFLWNEIWFLSLKNFCVICQFLGLILLPLAHIPTITMPAQLAPDFTVAYNVDKGILADVYLPSTRHVSEVPV